MSLFKREKNKILIESIISTIIFVSSIYLGAYIISVLGSKWYDIVNLCVIISIQCLILVFVFIKWIDYNEY
jgi:uncharacterized membrane protein (DUF485 family)